MEDPVNGLSTRKSDSNRSFYDLSQAYKSRVEQHSSDDFPVNEKVQLSLPTDKQFFYKSDHGTELCAFIGDNVIGKDFKFTSPFSGKLQVVYCDYTASGKASINYSSISMTFQSVNLCIVNFILLDRLYTV